MDGNTQSTTRRSLLATLGSGFAFGSLAARGAAATGDDSQYVLVQGERCVPIRPLRGQLPVEAFYEYQLPTEYVTDANGAVEGGSAAYASAGTRDLQRGQTSIAFLYQGPEGTSLVVVHGSVENSDAGAVTFRVSGLPEDGEWAVKDDLYQNPETGDIAASNYDRWEVDGDRHRIDWTWGTAGTDGGAFRDLGDDFAVRIDPAFNDEAALYGDHYEGTVTDWQFLSGSTDVSRRVSLDLNERVELRTGSCDDGRSDRLGGDDSDGEDGEDGDDESEDEHPSEHGNANGHEKGRGKGHKKGRGKGHEKGRGKGHEKGRGKGHEKHGDGETDDEDDESDDEDDDEN